MIFVCIYICDGLATVVGILHVKIILLLMTIDYKEEVLDTFLHPGFSANVR